MFFKPVGKELMVGVRDDVSEDINKRTRQTLCSGLQNPNLTIRNLSGTAHGV